MISLLSEDHPLKKNKTIIIIIQTLPFVFPQNNPTRPDLNYYERLAFPVLSAKC